MSTTQDTGAGTNKSTWAELTVREQVLLGYVAEQQASGYVPSRRDMADWLGLMARADVTAMIRKLEANGCIAGQATRSTGKVPVHLLIEVGVIPDRVEALATVKQTNLVGLNKSEFIERCEELLASGIPGYELPEAVGVTAQAFKSRLHRVIKGRNDQLSDRARDINIASLRSGKDGVDRRRSAPVPIALKQAQEDEAELTEQYWNDPIMDMRVVRDRLGITRWVRDAA